MKTRSIILFPKLRNIEVIEKLREKYDPLYHCIKPHITIVFPFESNLQIEELKKHVKESLKDIKPFKLKLKDITGATGQYLFLNVKESNDTIIKIHDNLYTGILKKYLYRKVSYIPHITVGHLTDERAFEAALNETEGVEDVFETTIDKVYMEIIDEHEKSNIEFVIQL